MLVLCHSFFLAFVTWVSWACQTVASPCGCLTLPRWLTQGYCPSVARAQLSFQGLQTTQYPQLTVTEPTPALSSTFIGSWLPLQIWTDSFGFISLVITANLWFEGLSSFVNQTKSHSLSQRESEMLCRIPQCSQLWSLRLGTGSGFCLLHPREVHAHHKALLLVLCPVKSYTAHTSRVGKLCPSRLCVVGVMCIPYALSCIFSFLIEVGFVYFR